MPADKFDFIHIGHGKCLSTMLQHRWSVSPRVNYFHGLDAGNNLSRAFLSGKRDPAQQKIEVQLPEDRPNVLSYECFMLFATAEDTDPRHRHLVIERQDFIASVLEPLSDRALMVLRDPVDWIASCHAQYVNYGGALDLQGYFDAFRIPLLDNLRLDRILPLWRGRGFEVTALPMETYRDDRNQFWGLYTDETGLEPPGETASHALADNRTQSEKIEPRARANRIVGTLIDAMGKNPLYAQSADHRKEAESLSMVNDQFRRWTVRRAFEAMTDADLAAFREAIGFRPDPTFRSLTLDAEARDILLDTYVAPLDAFETFAPYRARYRDSLAAAA